MLVKQTLFQAFNQKNIQNPTDFWMKELEMLKCNSFMGFVLQKALYEKFEGKSSAPLSRCPPGPHKVIVHLIKHCRLCVRVLRDV